MAELLSKEKLIEMEEKMVSIGTRFTGCKAHEDWIDYISEQMTNLGYEVKEDVKTFKRWEPKDWALSFETAEGEKVDVDKEDVSYYPYSGITDEEGVSGELKYCGSKGINTFYTGTKGKIAVIAMPLFQAGCGLCFKKRKGGIYPDTFTPPQKQSSPVVATFVIAPLITMARRAGAKAVICVMTGCSDEMARHQYLPFIKKYAGIPALWVGETTGKKIIAAAKAHKSASVKLTGTVEDNATTRTVYAVLPGMDLNRSILVNTHTDGVNAFEENAPIGLISLAKYFAEKPIEERKHTLVFSFVTGHFQLCQFGNAMNQVTTLFLNAHPEFWDGKEGHMLATAGVTLEHLGCTQWADNEDHTHFVKVSDVDPELVYASNDYMKDIYIEAVQGRKYTKTLVLRPKNFVHFGEGQPIYKKGIPDLSLCPGPDYLCNDADDGYIDKINYDMMEEQIETFRKVIERLDNEARKSIGKNDFYSLGFRF